MSDVYRTAPVPTLGESYEIGRAHGVKAAEKRIIKLLEEHRAWLVQHNHEGDNFIKAFAFQDAIALIKGDK